MTWTLTPDAGEFLTNAGDFLRGQPAENTIILTAAEHVRLQGIRAYGDEPPLFGWWQGPAGPVAACLHTPPFPVGLTPMPPPLAQELAGLLAQRGRPARGVNGETTSAWAFAAAWQARTGQTASVHRHSRLFRLDRLKQPPAPSGAPRTAAADDRDLLIDWLDAFATEVGDTPHGSDRVAGDRLSFGGLTLWEDGGAPVSMAGRQRRAAGHVRVGPVYTPPSLRGRGYAAAVTAAVTQQALDDGAGGVVLFTDLANPTSNALYPRLGYVPVRDSVMLDFHPVSP